MQAKTAARTTRIGPQQDRLSCTSKSEAKMLGAIQLLACHDPDFERLSNAHHTGTLAISANEHFQRSVSSTPTSPNAFTQLSILCNSYVAKRNYYTHQEDVFRRPHQPHASSKVHEQPCVPDQLKTPNFSKDFDAAQHISHAFSRTNLPDRPNRYHHTLRNLRARRSACPMMRQPPPLVRAT